MKLEGQIEQAHELFFEFLKLERAEESEREKPYVEAVIQLSNEFSKKITDSERSIQIWRQLFQRKDKVGCEHRLISPVGVIPNKFQGHEQYIWLLSWFYREVFFAVWTHNSLGKNNLKVQNEKLKNAKKALEYLSDDERFLECFFGYEFFTSNPDDRAKGNESQFRSPLRIKGLIKEFQSHLDVVLDGNEILLNGKPNFVTKISSQDSRVTGFVRSLHNSFIEVLGAHLYGTVANITNAILDLKDENKIDKEDVINKLR